MLHSAAAPPPSNKTEVYKSKCAAAAPRTVHKTTRSRRADCQVYGTKV